MLPLLAGKEATLKGQGMPLEHALASTFAGQLELNESEDYVEGPRAFADEAQARLEGALAGNP